MIDLNDKLKVPHFRALSTRSNIHLCAELNIV